MEVLNSLVELQQRHDLLPLIYCGDFHWRGPALDSFASVRAGLDEHGHDTLVSLLGGYVKRGDAQRGRLVHIRARLYELHDDVRVAFLSGEVHRRNVVDDAGALSTRVHSMW